jgi:hypothetical protein
MLKVANGTSVSGHQCLQWVESGHSLMLAEWLQVAVADILLRTDGVFENDLTQAHLGFALNL